MMYPETVDLNKLKIQAVRFSDESSLNHDKKRNNWSARACFSWGPGFDTGDKKLGEDKTSDLSSSLSFAGSLYLIFSQLSPWSNYLNEILNLSTSKPIVTLNSFSLVMKLS